MPDARIGRRSDWRARVAVCLLLLLGQTDRSSASCSQHLEEAGNEFGYRYRDEQGTPRCEGYYTQAVSRDTTGFEVIAFHTVRTSFELNADSTLYMIVHDEKQGGSDDISLCARVIYPLTYYRMDCDVSRESTVVWPLRVLLKEGAVNSLRRSEQLGVCAVARDSRNMRTYLPVSFRSGHAPSTLIPDSLEVVFRFKKSIRALFASIHGIPSSPWSAERELVINNPQNFPIRLRLPSGIGAEVRLDLKAVFYNSPAPQTIHVRLLNP